MYVSNRQAIENSMVFFGPLNPFHSLKTFSSFLAQGTIKQFEQVRIIVHFLRTLLLT